MYHQSVKNWREVERSATNLQSYWRDIKGVASNNIARTQVLLRFLVCFFINKRSILGSIYVKINR